MTKAGRWLSPLNVHVLPVLGGVPVDELTQADLERGLRQIWRAKPVTARKALNRVGIVPAHGAAMGLNVDPNAKAKALALLGDTGHAEANIPAMPWAEVPAFYASLSDGSAAHLALRLLILTAARSRPVRFAHADQFEGAVWTIPAEGEGARMKGRRGKVAPFRVPLSPEALDAVREATAQGRGGFLFPGARQGVISDATMSRLMERRGLAFRPHGFRAAFKTWARETGAAPDAVIEAQLAHRTEGKVAAAYTRTDFLEQRAGLIQRWAEYVQVGNRQ